MKRMSNNAVKANTSGNLRTAPVQAATISHLHFIPNSHLQCCYTNDTRQFQIIRMAAIAGEFLEKAVPPQARAFFEASAQDHLEIHAGTAITSILSDKIPCIELACLASWPV